jgi:hypothetical protein
MKIFFISNFFLNVDLFLMIFMGISDGMSYVTYISIKAFYTWFFL